MHQIKKKEEKQKDMGTKAIKEKQAVENIVKSGKLTVGNKTIDISDKLNNYESKEYRQKDIDKIDTKLFEKCSNTCTFKVIANGSETVAFRDEYKDKQICVLNFASSRYPGGGFLTGAVAQEEVLCYNSNLHSILSKHEKFYDYNRTHLCDGQYSDGIIFTKNCLFFRNKYINIEPKFVDIITCAAPNAGAARKNGISEAEIECTMSRRIEQILKVAIANNVKILALGAFGCGVFKNDPYKVASIMHTILEIRGYGDYFEEVIFPMNGTIGDNVKAFVKEFKN